MRARVNDSKEEQYKEQQNIFAMIYKWMILVSIAALIISLVFSAIAGYPDSPDQDDYDDYDDYDDAREKHYDTQRILYVTVGLLRSIAAIMLGFGLIFGALFDKEISDGVRIGMFVAGGLVMAFYFTGVRLEDFFAAFYN